MKMNLYRGSRAAPNALIDALDDELNVENAKKHLARRHGKGQYLVTWKTKDKKVHKKQLIIDDYNLPDLVGNKNNDDYTGEKSPIIINNPPISPVPPAPPQPVDNKILSDLVKLLFTELRDMRKEFHDRAYGADVGGEADDDGDMLKEVLMPMLNNLAAQPAATPPAATPPAATPPAATPPAATPPAATPPAATPPATDEIIRP